MGRDALCPEDALEDAIAHSEIKTGGHALPLYGVDALDQRDIRLISVDQISARGGAYRFFAFAHRLYRHVSHEQEIESAIIKRERAAQAGVNA